MTANEESHGAAVINIIEKRMQENAALRAENQRLRTVETAANEVARIWPAYRLYHDQNYVALCQAMRGLESALERDNANH